MLMDAKQKWNQKYIEKIQNSDHPAPDERLVSLIDYFKGGRALDFACGLGANSLFLAENGYQVDALDISEIAIEFLKQEASKRQLPVQPRVADLTNTKTLDLEAEAIDLAVITYYLDRNIFPFIKSIIKENGYFFMETFYLTPDNIGQGISDKYKLNSNELLTIFNDWQVFLYEENEEAGRQTIFARKKIN